MTNGLNESIRERVRRAQNTPSLFGSFDLGRATGPPLRKEPQKTIPVGPLDTSWAREFGRRAPLRWKPHDPTVKFPTRRTPRHVEKPKGFDLGRPKSFDEMFPRRTIDLGPAFDRELDTLLRRTKFRGTRPWLNRGDSPSGFDGASQRTNPALGSYSIVPNLASAQNVGSRGWASRKTNQNPLRHLWLGG